MDLKSKCPTCPNSLRFFVLQSPIPESSLSLYTTVSYHFHQVLGFSQDILPPPQRLSAAVNKPGDRRSKYSGAAMGDAGEIKTEVCINADFYHCCKSCARKRRTRYLPQEIVFEFLLQVPAQVLHHVMGRVCREWKLMIHSQNFIRHHLQNSTSGILIQDLGLARNGIYVEMRGGCLEICKFDWGLWGFRDVVRTTCNGLVLTLDYIDLHILYVVNPLTKQRVILPPYFDQIRCFRQFRLAFVEASMEYKVVQAYPFVPKPEIAVLTIGVDKVWRRIDIKHLSVKSRITFMVSPVVTRAYIHWVGLTFVLTFDVETETIRQFPLPQLLHKCRNFLPMGGNLSIVSESTEFFRDVWEMNSKTGKWIKLLSFDLGPLSYKFPDLFPKFLKDLIPFGWLAAREVLVFGASGSERFCVAYNFRTREIQSFELVTTVQLCNFQAHMNSLVWL